MNLVGIKKGDIARRLIGESMPMDLRVSDVTATQIICGAWTFDRYTGAEIDEELGWDADHSGSKLTGFKPG